MLDKLYRCLVLKVLSLYTEFLEISAERLCVDPDCRYGQAVTSARIENEAKVEWETADKTEHRKANKTSKQHRRTRTFAEETELIYSCFMLLHLWERFILSKK